MLSTTSVATTLSSIPGKDRVDAWRELCRESFLGDSVWATAEPADRFSGSIRRLWIDDVLFVESNASGYGASFQAGSTADEYIGFGVSTTSYGERLTLRDSTVVDLRSPVCLWANSRVRRYEQASGGHSMMLYAPVDALRSYVGSAVDKLVIDTRINSPASRVMYAMLQALSDESDAIEPDQAIPLRNSLLELMARMVVHGPALESNTAAVSSVMKSRVVAWIDNQLQFGSVSPVEAAAAHGISVRSLQRLFEDGGGSFSAAVRCARLAKARQDVVTTRDSLQTIALRWGFSDPPHFSREFRRTYLTSPSDLRADLRMPEHLVSA